MCCSDEPELWSWNPLDLVQEWKSDFGRRVSLIFLVLNMICGTWLTRHTGILPMNWHRLFWGNFFQRIDVPRVISKNDLLMIFLHLVRTSFASSAAPSFQRWVWKSFQSVPILKWFRSSDDSYQLFFFSDNSSLSSSATTQYLMIGTISGGQFCW